jgi:hypothetical protein
MHSTKPAAQSASRAVVDDRARAEHGHGPQRLVGQRRRDLVVAVDARDLLDEVDRDAQVVAMGRHRAAQADAFVHRGDVDAREQPRDRCAVEAGAEESVHARRVERDRRHRGPRRTERLDDAGRDAPAGELGQQPRRPVDRAPHAGRVDLALEAVRRLGRQAEPARRAAHAARVEVRALEEDVGRARGHLGLGAAHYAGDRDRALGVGDHEVVRGERARGTVQRRDLLVGARATHADLPAVDRRPVERVQRLSELEQHEVRHVDDDVDRAHAGRGKPLGEPRRTRPDRDAAHEPRVVARAALAVLDLDPHRRGRRLTLLLRLDRRHAQRTAEVRAHLARDAEDGRAVAAIRRQRDLEHRVAGRDHRIERRADRRARVEHEDALVLLRERELLRRADHPIRHDAADLRLPELRAVRQRRAGHRDRDLLPRRDVRRAAHDLDRRPVAEIHLAEREAVGVRMLRPLDDEADAELRQVGTEALDRLDLETAARQRGRDRRRVRRLDELGEPRARHPHPSCSSTRRSPSNIRWMFGMPQRSIAARSSVMPNAKPCHRSASRPQFASTAGWIIPQPPASIQPVCEQVPQPAPPHRRQR